MQRRIQFSKIKKYFIHVKLVEANVTTISSATNLIEGYKKATVMLLGETKIIIDNALFSSRSIEIY